MIDLSILNPEQKKAVETTEGALLVLAGAGSGKTRVLTYRIAYILDSGLAGPDNILAMTFTNKAAGEMKERVVKLLRENAQKVKIRDKEEGLMLSPNVSVIATPSWMGTFHSICVRILRIYGEHVGLDRNFSIFDPDDQQSVVKEAMKRLDISIKETNPRAVMSYISTAKNELVTPIDYEAFASGYFQQIVAKVYPLYQKILKENNAVDFDDLIMLTIKLMQDNKEVKEKLQERFKYILVDEYQDTNHAQYILVKLFAEKYKNICCVGDDDQSIYSFRGATVQNILTFEKDYPEVNIVKLEQNYRSTKKILEASHQVISQNKNRRDKKLWTENGDGDHIIIYTASNERDEGRWIADKIEGLSKDNVKLSEIAILYRTNAQSRSLEEAFINAGIPYKIIGGLKFYERKEIKDIIAYLKCIYNQKDNKSLERVINVPRRGIGDKTFAELIAQARGAKLGGVEYLTSNKSEIQNPKFESFAKIMSVLIEKSNVLNIIDLINLVLDKTGYIKMLEDGTMESEARIENIKELISVASKYIDDKAPEGLQKFLEEVSLLEEDIDKKVVQDSVTLMTIHAAKGLEFNHIFVAGAEENLFPHANSLFDQAQMEEERRLAYVAITRAKQYLYLTHAVSRIYFGSRQQNQVSRFLNDIDPSLIKWESANGTGGVDSLRDDPWEDATNDTNEFKSNVNLEIGDRVKHEYFGVGSVKYIDDEMIVVNFGPAYGQKELMLEYARLTKI